ncbi:hypothetical protein Lfu02_16540 [Longispora fulva]|uniref:Uncharacterized protein n=1 Tax=Longispora fulva TaxID=619741 RepID=A0A8J7KT51_9ACTN|nr:hypothetical protein [Longispora fulva]GIG57282.1 hypothetical protein Lfu02_16540 [Longispora fulva]
MVSAGRHPKKDIAEALRRARDLGLRIDEIHRGHRWGQVVCDNCGDKFAIFSTPQDPGSHAKRLDGFVRGHDHA